MLSSCQTRTASPARPRAGGRSARAHHYSQRPKYRLAPWLAAPSPSTQPPVNHLPPWSLANVRIRTPPGLLTDRSLCYILNCVLGSPYHRFIWVLPSRTQGCRAPIRSKALYLFCVLSSFGPVPGDPPQSQSRRPRPARADHCRQRLAACSKSAGHGPNQGVSRYAYL